LKTEEKKLPENTLAAVVGFTAKAIPWHPVMQFDLCLHGQETGLRLNGVHIEAAYLWQGHYVLLTADDGVYETGFDVYVIDQNLRILDHAGAGWATSGEIENLQLVLPDRILFRLPGRQWLWSVKFFEKPKWRLPFGFPGLSDPWPVMRLAGGKCKHFEIQLLDRPPIR
jgi:hypothetical protein